MIFVPHNAVVHMCACIYTTWYSVELANSQYKRCLICWEASDLLSCRILCFSVTLTVLYGNLGNILLLLLQQMMIVLFIELHNRLHLAAGSGRVASQYGPQHIVWNSSLQETQKQCQIAVSVIFIWNKLTCETWISQLSDFRI